MTLTLNWYIYCRVMVLTLFIATFLQNGESEYRNAGFFQALPTMTIPESSQPLPTLLPGLSTLYSYVIIGVLALVMAVILCTAVGVASFCCCNKQQHKKPKGISLSIIQYWTSS